MKKNVEALDKIGNLVNTGGNALFTSCNLAEGQEGRELLKQVGNLFEKRLNIFASKAFNYGSIYTDGTPRFGKPIINRNLVVPYDGTYYKNTPLKGFLYIPSGSDIPINIQSDKRFTGNILLNEKGEQPVEIEKKESEKKNK